MPVVQRTHMPPGMPDRVNQRVVNELEIRALWVASPSFLSVLLNEYASASYDAIQTQKLYEPIQPLFQPQGVHTSVGAAGKFDNKPAGPKNTDARAWQAPFITRLTSNVVTLFAVASTVNMSGGTEWICGGAGTRLGYEATTNKMMMGEGLANVSSAVLPYPANDGQMHTWVGIYNPEAAIGGLRHRMFLDGNFVGNGSGGATPAVDNTNFIVGAIGAGTSDGWVGNIALAGQSSSNWSPDSVIRFGLSPFEVLWPDKLPTFTSIPPVPPAGQITARRFNMLPVVQVDAFSFESTVHSTSLDTAPVIAANDIEVESVIGARNLHTLPVIDEAD